MWEGWGLRELGSLDTKTQTQNTLGCGLDVNARFKTQHIVERSKVRTPQEHTHLTQASRNPTGHRQLSPWFDWVLRLYRSEPCWTFWSCHLKIFLWYYFYCNNSKNWGSLRIVFDRQEPSDCQMHVLKKSQQMGVAGHWTRIKHFNKFLFSAHQKPQCTCYALYCL